MESPRCDHMHIVTTFRCLDHSIVVFQLICRWDKVVIGHRTLRVQCCAMATERQLSRIDETSSGRELKA